MEETLGGERSSSSNSARQARGHVEMLLFESTHLGLQSSQVAACQTAADAAQL
jgi:hypothetical protein